MGSTGHGTFKHSRQGASDGETFGIGGAVIYKGKIPAGSGLSPVGSNKITLKIPIGRRNSILFQFKLSKDNKLMTITGYKNGVPEVKCKVDVDSGRPSLDHVIATGDKTERANAVKMKDLMHKQTNVNENQLGAIAQKLLKKKGTKEMKKYV